MQDTDYFRIGIQKKGRLRDASIKLLRSWNIDVPPYAGEGIHDFMEIESPLGILGLLSCRIESLSPDVAEGYLEAAIVSSDVFDKWRANADQLTQRKMISDSIGLIPAGSGLRFGINPHWMGKEQTTWQAALEFCRNKRLPIFTSDKDRLIAFLKRRKVSLKNLKIVPRSGTIEAHGRMLGSPLICDLVGSGNSMREQGYEPVSTVDIIESQVCLIGREPREPEKLAVFAKLFSAARAFSTDTAPA